MVARATIAHVQSVAAESGIRLAHHGDYAYTLEDLMRSPKPGAAPMALTRHADGSLVTKMLEGVSK